MFCSIVTWKKRFAEFLPLLAKRCALHQIHSWKTTFSWKVSFLNFELKTAFCKVFIISCWKILFILNPLMQYNSFLKSVFCFILGWKQRFTSFLPFLAEKCVLHQIHSWNTFLFWKVCFSQFRGWKQNSRWRMQIHSRNIFLFWKVCFVPFKLKTAIC